jgi:hypothetical protein
MMNMSIVVWMLSICVINGGGNVFELFEIYVFIFLCTMAVALSKYIVECYLPSCTVMCALA